MARTLSQQGLVHVPLNPRQRGTPGIRTALDRRNENEKGRWLHPTKGWRKMSQRRTVIEILTADRKTGLKVQLSMMRLMIRNARKEDAHVNK